MRKVCTFFAAVSVVLSALTPATQWREKMDIYKNDGSTAPLEGALKIAESFGNSDPPLLETLIQLADACEDGTCAGRSNEYLGRALRIRSNIRPQDAHFATLLMDLAGAAADQDRSKDALLVYREALALREKLFGSQHQSVAETYAAIARVCQMMNDQAQARRTMQYALGIRQQAGQEQSAGFADLLEDSARPYNGSRPRSSHDGGTVGRRARGLFRKINRLRRLAIGTQVITVNNLPHRA
jgi:tetratricopeptide (TPR) repeat protein